MAIDPNVLFTDPVPEGITVTLALEAFGGSREAALAWFEPYARALMDELGQVWFLVASGQADAALVDLEPAQADVPPGAAWNFAYALLRDSRVGRADPAFEIVSDVALEADRREDLDAPAESLAESTTPLHSKMRDWPVRQLHAREAWALTPPPGGRSKGEGVVIYHPDAGYLAHGELKDGVSGADRILRAEWKNFVEDGQSPEHPDGEHGLATSGVAMSWDNADPPDEVITGIAPRALLVPLRVAKKRPLIPVPTLFRSGQIRLRRAVEHATRPGSRCQVISISLGWLPHEPLHLALREAVRQNIIVCSASGNYLRSFVVWPAAYPEVIACAGCDAHYGRWFWSGRGAKVDISGPADGVWVARSRPEGVGMREFVERSDGTSYAAASCAGIAALWLAHWTRDHLLGKYAGRVVLQEVFRYLLRETAQPFASGPLPEFGRGIADAHALLNATLPEADTVLAAQPRYPALDARERLMSRPMGPTLHEAIGSTSAARLDTLVARLVPETVPAEALSEVQDEVLFHLLTTPALRGQLVPAGEPPPAEGPGPEALRMAGFDDRFLSDRLRTLVGR